MLYATMHQPGQSLQGMHRAGLVCKLVQRTFEVLMEGNRTLAVERENADTARPELLTVCENAMGPIRASCRVRCVRCAARWRIC